MLTESSSGHGHSEHRTSHSTSIPTRTHSLSLPSSPTSQSSPSSTLSIGSSTRLTTSTVTTTQVRTITSCPPSVQDCPANQRTTFVTTETITLLTTICPVTAIETGTAATQTSIPANPQLTTSTVFTTQVHTVTACPPAVKDCPASEKTSYITTETVPAYTTTYEISPVTAIELSVAATASSAVDKNHPSAPLQSGEGLSAPTDHHPTTAAGAKETKVPNASSSSAIYHSSAGAVYSSSSTSLGSTTRVSTANPTYTGAASKKMIRSSFSAFALAMTLYVVL